MRSYNADVDARRRAYDASLDQPQPKLRTLNVGASVELHDIDEFCAIWGLTKKQKETRGPDRPLAKRILTYMGVPLIFWPNGHIYFNVASLELAFAYLTRFGGPGLIAPSSLEWTFCKAADRPQPIDPADIRKFAREVQADAMLIGANRRKKAERQTKRYLNRVARQLGADGPAKKKPATPTEEVLDA
jgi:hypothetical protein